MKELNKYIQSKLEESTITQYNGLVIPSKGIKLSKNEKRKIVMIVGGGCKVKFSNVDNSLADILGFNKSLDYRQGFHESQRIFNILGVNNVRIINDLVQGLEL